MTILTDPAAAAGGFEGSIMRHSKMFDEGVSNLQERLRQALDEVRANPGDSTVLAGYQAVLAEYTVYRNLQSNSTKRAYDLAMSVIANLR